MICNKRVTLKKVQHNQKIKLSLKLKRISAANLQFSVDNNPPRSQDTRTALFQGYVKRSVNLF